MDCDSPFPLMEMVMARALSDDLRVRVLEAGAAGGSARSLAKCSGSGFRQRSGGLGAIVKAANGRGHR